MKLTIPADDFGNIWIFSSGLEFDKSDLEQVFGVRTLNPDFVDIVSIRDLGTLSLTDYIAQGYDIEVPEFDAEAVNAISQHAVLIMSRAVRRVETALTLPNGIVHIATCSASVVISNPEPLQSEAAKGNLDGPPIRTKKSDARVGGMVATIALIFMFALVGVMIWIAA